MKKYIIIASVVLAGLMGFIILNLSSPSTYKTEKEIKVSGNYALAYIILNGVNDWPKWYSWQKEAPAMRFTPGGRDVNVGASFNFKGPVIGEGTTIIQESLKDSLITARISSNKLPSDLLCSWSILPENNASVYVTFRARLAKPIPFYKRYFYKSLDKQLEKRFDRDLAGMKDYMEGLIKTQFGMSREAYGEKYYVGIREPIVNSKIPSFYARVYPKIYAYLDSLNITPTGPPVGLTYDWDGENNYVYIMAALPVPNKIKVRPGFECEKVGGTQCIKLAHYGFYSTLRNAHVKLDYIVRNLNLQLDAPIIEEYVTSPSQEPDTSKWLTNIYYLINSNPGNTKAFQNRSYEDMIKMQERERQQKLEEYNRHPQ